LKEEEEEEEEKKKRRGVRISSGEWKNKRRRFAKRIKLKKEKEILEKLKERTYRFLKRSSSFQHNHE
jgi:hypothetical protein